MTDLTCETCKGEGQYACPADIPDCVHPCNACGEVGRRDPTLAEWDALDRKCQAAELGLAIATKRADALVAEQDRLLGHLADIRGHILDAYGEGHPMYERWLAPSVGEPADVVGLAQEAVNDVKSAAALVAERDRYMEVLEWVRDYCNDMTAVDIAGGALDHREAP